jgi:hypothetical protein
MPTALMPSAWGRRGAAPGIFSNWQRLRFEPVASAHYHLNSEISMTMKSGKNKGFYVVAYQGDAKTLLAFNFADKKSAKDLAGFTIQCQPDDKTPYYIFNFLRYQRPADHAQVATEPAFSSINAPIHKFRWLHVPGQVHQGTKPFFGTYTYTVTPRYFDDKGSMKPIDTNQGASVEIDVTPFAKNGLELGFTRGYVQSQAFVHHFGSKVPGPPAGSTLLFDTSKVAGTSPSGRTFTYQDEYEWLGYTARQKIFALLNEVLSNDSLHVDIFAYDLNEPDLMRILLELAKEGRIRIILDNAPLHHTGTAKKGTKPKTAKPGKKGSKSKAQKGPTAEDQFEKMFDATAKGNAAMLRGKFGRFSHDKIFIVSDKKTGPTKVLTGSTNFSVTGIYVNSNHILIFNDPEVAMKYAEVFEESWKDEVHAPAFEKSSFSSQAFSFSSKLTPKTEVTFSPHTDQFATTILDGIVTRIKQEKKTGKTEGSVLFAVMDDSKGTGPVYPALKALHSNQSIFSYGISDAKDGLRLYRPGEKEGLLVTGKPAKSKLPPPFDQVPNIGGFGHQIHHKFIVCGFNGDNPVVYCGSSNLAEGGETHNGDNLLAIHDADVATVFAIEALALVDHFDFLDRSATGPKGAKRLPKTPSKQQAAVDKGWFLSTSDKWTEPYFDPKDLKCVDRELFA